MTISKSKPDGASPPHKIPPLVTGSQPSTGLTPIFNAAAAKPAQVSRQPKQAASKPMGINELKRQYQKIGSQLSKLTTTLESSPVGSVVRGLNQSRDLQLSKQLARVSAQIQHAEKLGGLRHGFATAANHGSAKQNFNRSARRSV